MAVLCPKCHHPFTKELEEEKLFDESENKEKKLDLIAGPPLMGGATRRPDLYEESESVIDVTYEERYKCKHCGYEWTELKTNEGEIKDK